ncbi:MAG: mechanosensitive ion channel family protein [Holosporaceae bacterium]|nr:mechanosensitive ion channel family protein [Holosporaceae bacterium]
MNFLLNLCGLTPSSVINLDASTVAVMISAAAAILLLATFFVSKKFAKTELGKLAATADNKFDQLIILVSGLALSLLLILLGITFLEAMGDLLMSAGEKMCEFQKKLTIIISSVLIASYVLIAPDHGELGLLPIPPEDAQRLYRKIESIALASFFMATIVYPLGCFMTKPENLLLLECASMAILLLIYFIEMVMAKELMRHIFALKYSGANSMSLKITKFINEKFTFLTIAGMLMLIVANHENRGMDSLAFLSKVTGVFLFLLGSMIIQATIVFVINKFFAKLDELGHSNDKSKAASQKIKDLVWICDVIVLSAYFFALCGILNFVGVEVVRYVFYDNFVKMAWLLFVTALIYKGVHEFESAILEKAENDNRDYYLKLKTFSPVISIVFDTVLFLIAALIGLANLNVNVTPILAAFSIFSAAVGLAAKDTIQAFLNGITLLMERNLYVGERVVVNGLKGIVVKLSIRVMHLRGEDGGVHIIPYNLINTITNYSGEYKRHFDDLRVMNRDDVEKVMAILKKIIQDMKKESYYCEKIIGDVIIHGIKPFDLTGIKIFWEIVTTPDLEDFRIKCDVYDRLLTIFGKKKICIPQISTIDCLFPS